MNDDKYHALNPEPSSFEWKGYPPTIVIHGRDASSGDTVTRVSAPGAESVARISSAGTVSLVISGAEGVGREGESRVADVVRTRLEQDGLRAELLPGTDHRGEDRRLRTAEHNLNLQVVTVPANPDLWGAARHGSSSTAVSLEGAVEWINQTIQKKVERTAAADRKGMVLALDAQHANPLVEPAVIAAYLANHGDPSANFGFAGVWIVGSTSSQCERLGNSVV